MPEITSVQNAQVKYLHRLYQKSRLRRADEKFIIDNPKIISHLMTKPAAAVQITELYYTDKFSRSHPQELTNQVELTPKSIAPAVLEKITGQTDNPGLVAVATFQAGAMFLAKPAPGSILVLDNLQDPGNVGTLIRSAHGVGLNHICFVGTSVDVLNPKVIRASMGSFAYLTYSTIGHDQLELLKNSRVVAGAHRNQAIPYTQWAPPVNADATSRSRRSSQAGDSGQSGDPARPGDSGQSGQAVALCIGSEAAGLANEVQAICDVMLEIPLSPYCESLNAAAAGAILLFHLFGSLNKQ